MSISRHSLGDDFKRRGVQISTYEIELVARGGECVGESREGALVRGSFYR